VVPDDRQGASLPATPCSGGADDAGGGSTVRRQLRAWAGHPLV